MLILKDKDIYLKPVSLKDALPLMDLINKNRGHISEWLSFTNEIKTLGDEKNEIKKWIKKEKIGEGIFFGVWYKKNYVD